MKKNLLSLVLILILQSSLYAQWSELGGLNGLAANNLINSVCSDALGNMYAGGDFTNSSGNWYVAKWNGTAWSELGGLNGLAANNLIASVCSDASGNIYAAGFFTNSSGNRYVAKWNGTAWSELGGLNGLAAFQGIVSVCSDASGNIYAGGFFYNSSFNRYVAKYSIATGIDNISGEKLQLEVYPNPATSELRIKNAELRKVEVIDIFGKNLFQSEINNHKSELVINISELPAGIYIVKMFDGERSYCKKLIVEHN
ncbi:MAG TPA: T9SS type A sorting domain-containing protein [Chitinophagaceae bacterium]|nr:T9SS type A sorting domain-containing protein [Chitinophagaceae bacterium]